MPCYWWLWGSWTYQAKEGQFSRQPPSPTSHGQHLSFSGTYPEPWALFVFDCSWEGHHQSHTSHRQGWESCNGSFHHSKASVSRCGPFYFIWKYGVSGEAGTGDPHGAAHNTVPLRVSLLQTSHTITPRYVTAPLALQMECCKLTVIYYVIAQWFKTKKYGGSLHWFFNQHNWNLLLINS